MYFKPCDKKYNCDKFFQILFKKKINTKNQIHNEITQNKAY